MFELKHSQAWNSPFARILPTADLTATEKKRIKEREEIIELVSAQTNKNHYWLKINNGIFKGTIFQADKTRSGYQKKLNPTVFLEIATDDPRQPARDYSPQNIRNRTPQWAEKHVVFHIGCGNQPIKFKNGEVLFPQHLPDNTVSNCSLLIDYEGGPVFCIDTAKRPETFTDRLGQDVKIGDLVVVAYNYGAGLDICMVRGFTDETRVLIESVETGEYERIPLEDNATVKIMRLPNKLEDIALMMKLARK